MIFAAGLGTRLKPLTDNMPKALVPLRGIPMIERVMRRLVDAGFNDITVNVHHFAGMIVDFIERNNGFGATVHISDESDRLLDTGGGILKARRWLDGDGPFLVHNVDIMTDIDLRQMYRHHIDTDNDATLLVSSRETSRYLLVDGNRQLQGWMNVKTHQVLPEGFTYDHTRYSPVAFGGVHVLSPRLFDALEQFSTDPKFSIIPFYLSACRHYAIKGYTPSAPYRWHDIGKPETLAQAASDLADPR